MRVRKGFCGPTTPDPRSDDRASVLWRLRSGSPEGNSDHPVHKRRLQISGGVAHRRSYEVRDLISENDLDSIKAAHAMPLWSAAFAAFILNGFQLEVADAELALASLRTGQNPNQLVNCIVRTHDHLLRDLSGLHSAAPADICFLAATWPADLRPREPYAAWGALSELLSQHSDLLKEVQRLRKSRFATINEGAGARHDRLKKALKETVTDRAETYLAILALEHFADATTTADIAEKLNKLVEGRAGNPKIGENSKLLLSPDRLRRRLQDVWDKLGLPYPNQRNTKRAADR